MGVNGLNPVQKATYFEKNQNWKDEYCTVTVNTATDE